MKLVKIGLKNIGKHENTEIEINKPLTIIFGDVENGKTTVLNAVKWGLGCVVPDNVIKEGCEEGEIFITFDTATSRRTFYKNRDGVEVARPLEYVENGKLVKEPIKYLKTKINPFLLNNEFFMQMSTNDQMKFFVSLFGIDTTAENKLLTEQEENNKTLRAEIKGIGEIIPVKVDKPDLDALKLQKEKLDGDNQLLKNSYDLAVLEWNEAEQKGKNVASNIQMQQRGIARLQEKIDLIKLEIQADEKWILDNPQKAYPISPVYASTSTIEEKISNAKADEIRYEAYKSDVQKLQAKQAKEEELKEGELKVREIRAAKIAKLESFSDKTGISELKFIEGGYTYQGINFDMLSTSARMDLSDKLSALFPSDFDIDLIDRAESLGRKNLINLGEIAAKGKRTIIATVVSDNLAIDDENVGVFKIEDGNVV